MLRAAIIGREGKWGRTWHNKLKERKDIQICYACDIKYANLKASEIYAGVEIVPYFTEVGPVDIVFIAAYPDKHHTIASYFINMGTDVFVTVPAALSNEELHSLVEMGQEKGVRIGIDFQETPTYELIRQKIRGRKIEEVNDERMIVSPHPSNRLYGIFMDEDLPSIHFYHMMESLFGVDSNSIQCEVRGPDELKSSFTANKGSIKCTTHSKWVEAEADSRKIIFKCSDGQMSVATMPYLDKYALIFDENGKREMIVIDDKVEKILNDFVISVSKNEQSQPSLYNHEAIKAHEDSFLSITQGIFRI